MTLKEQSLKLNKGKTFFSDIKRRNLEFYEFLEKLGNGSLFKGYILFELEFIKLQANILLLDINNKYTKEYKVISYNTYLRVKSEYKNILRNNRKGVFK
jgi:hypothetical protein